MYGEIFRKIDNLISGTDLGKYIELGAKNDYVNGKKLISKLFAVTPDWSGYLEKQEKELAKEIKKKLGDIDYEKYLMYLESTDVDKLEFIISEDLLVDIEHLLQICFIATLGI